MAIKLIATDLNGTLLHDDQTFNQSLFKQTLQDLKARGINLVLSSGNQFAHLETLFHEVMADNLAIVAENGASIYLQGQQVFDGSLSPEQVQHFVTVDRRQDFLKSTYIILVGQRGSYTETGAPQVLIDAAEKFYDNLQQVTDLSTVDDRIKKISISAAPGQAAKLVADLNEYFAGHLQAHDSGYGVVDVVAANVGKLPAVQWLAERWHVAADEIMAFGDGANDVPLLQFAKHSWAMLNAPDEVQRSATRVTSVDNQHDGVLTTIQAALMVI
ncbi:Cof-type HAD-IIB family hydrolase [Levilactobacillus tujiorum]|uniref:HAD family hydrolase n=1 Tax=Levilactobacillus tujiorum TaxID=2912243 RepID=A0ABX1L3D2_9LACO|nr:Cof-type HAD-IIB family hydrolase [Levilactobacillus tujiorum]MCH5464550.1 Cof-type HAD-IIB family hydrolase [Levilactobacillus tujiorum]NLR11752.1 HAD family hydrolase [Lactobacillus sp. HBUAS51387]NLR29530.1 HAD family hydrolase [Levilactobacillus tujiorum]